MSENVHQDELEFIYYKRGTSGSFSTGLYDLYWKADIYNRLKLETAFPELWVIRDYSTKPGYWDDLVARAKQDFPNLKLQ